MNAEQFVLTVAQHLVEKPHKVLVTSNQGHGTRLIELEVAKSDVGKIIGKGGKTANAIRILLAAGCNGRERIALEIIEPEND